MQKNQRYFRILTILIVTLAVVVISITGWQLYTHNQKANTKSKQNIPQVEQTGTPKRQECPKAWIYDAMPGIGGDSNRPPREYFVYNDTRVKAVEVDVDWVKEHCQITQPTTVQ